MNRTVKVFDFDKTLTDRDTLFGFYKTVAGNDWLFSLKQILLFTAGVLYKTGLIRNDMLKSIGIALFLRGRTRIELEAVARKYARQIELNDIYLNHYKNIEDEKWIISASPEIYLKHLFPGEKIAGTTFNYDEDKMNGLAVNMFGNEKKRFLREKGVINISELYTDSMSDKPLMEMSEKVFIVKKGSITQSK